VKGIFAQMLRELSDQGGETNTLMIDATHLKTHRTASSLGLKRVGGRLIGRTKGGMNSKLHAVTAAAGRPLRMFLTAGQRSDYIGARALQDGLPPAEHLLADRGHDADWYREALEEKGIKRYVPARKGRKVAIPHDEARYRKRHRIDNSFARLKDWRRVASRYDRCRKVFLSACALAEHLQASTKLFMVETTAPILDPSRGRTKTGYLWALARDDRSWGGADPPGVVFYYAPDRGGKNAEIFLHGFDGILQLDGYTGYNRLTRPSRKGGDPTRSKLVTSFT
jgi:transposase